MSARTVVGVDFGATLAKIVTHGEPSSAVVLPAGDIEAIRGIVLGRSPARVGATGGGAAKLGERVGNTRVTRVGEFDAWAIGVKEIAAATRLTLPDVHLITCVGTGTSVVRAGPEGAERIGGTAVGGGTFMGLGRLLTPATRFEDLVVLATLGDRQTVDLLVGEVYPGDEAPAILRALTAANFAKLASLDPPDLAHAIVGLVGETVALVTGALAKASGSDTVVYCGSTLVRNAPLVDVLQAVTGHFGHRSHVLEHAGIAGAWGAAALAKAEPE